MGDTERAIYFSAEKIELVRLELQRRRGLLVERLDRLDAKKLDKKTKVTVAGTRVSTRITTRKPRAPKMTPLEKAAKALGITAEQMKELGL